MCAVDRGENEEIASTIAKFLVTLAQAVGFLVCLIFDGDSRCHSKRVVKRGCVCEQDIFNAV